MGVNPHIFMNWFMRFVAYIMFKNLLKPDEGHKRELRI